MSSADLPAPTGFERHFRQSPLTDPWEPIYSRKTERSVVIGLFIGERHCNSRRFGHGGLISSLTDNAMGLSCGQCLGEGKRLVTVNLSIDYLDAVKIGDWLEIRTEFVRTGSTLCFAQAFVTVGEKVCARANGTFRVIDVR